MVAEFQKVSGARRMAEQLSRRNRSRSYQVLIAGIDLCQNAMVCEAQVGGDDAD
jgi:hypothetical protein